MAWTTDQLKEHFEALRDADNEARRVALSAAEKRLDGMNEFRESLADQQRMFLPRKESETVFAAISEKLETLQRMVDKRANERTGAGIGWSIALAIFGLVTMSVGFVLSFMSE